MDALEAIRKRRAVRSYTDDPVDDATLDRLLKLALVAPTGGGTQAWSLMVIRDPERRLQIADLIIAGGAKYFAIMRPPAEGHSAADHEQWAVDYANQILASYRVVPVWLVAVLVPRNNYPAVMAEGGHIDDVLSLAFAMENLMVAARSMGLGTVPTTAFQRFEKDRLREILGVPSDVDPMIVSPLGRPVAFPEGLPPAIKANRRTWKTLVHDEQWGATRS
jgi:nitroreductase